ncbi:hypothetical protein J3Q64DRAFT_1179572 [Phycomyces blakesleeanus]|uniref:Uncharacterized protein n=1 Tax=Phycomyces blakesleeanus TaxID=4837 RepID=A0ABR3AUA1_PHYBL
MQKSETISGSRTIASIPQSVIDDDSHHTMYYSQALPYAHLLGGEAEQWLETICTNLAIAVRAQDYQSGVVAWTRRLCSYLDMKHALSRDVRANLAKIMFDLTIAPGMDTALIELWANLCVRLIR